MTVTNEGLRIDLTESEKGTFFDSGSAKISGDGEELLRALGEELGKLPNTIAMEGHTDSKKYSAASNYGNWELSSDRANASNRRISLIVQYLEKSLPHSETSEQAASAEYKESAKDAVAEPPYRRKRQNITDDSASQPLLELSALEEARRLAEAVQTLRRRSRRFVRMIRPGP